jgi:zinc/manganese transport system substrate-binding protein
MRLNQQTPSRTLCAMFALLFGLVFSVPSFAQSVKIIAAENFYGTVAKAIGGEHVEVKSILSRPDQDPHLFEVTPRTVQGLNQADLIVYNGLGYDTWMKRLLEARDQRRSTTVFCVGTLLGKKEGDNPHIWYDVNTMSVYATALKDFLSKQDPAHQASYQTHYRVFMQGQQQLAEKIQQLKKRLSGMKVIATEPVFGEMAKALGLTMSGQDFQTSVMNGIDPTPRQVADFRTQLSQGHVAILFYNTQVSSPLVSQLLTLAKKQGIQIIGVTETQPANQTYQTWMRGILEQLLNFSEKDKSLSSTQASSK